MKIWAKNEMNDLRHPGSITEPLRIFMKFITVCFDKRNLPIMPEYGGYNLIFKFLAVFNGAY